MSALTFCSSRAHVLETPSQIHMLMAHRDQEEGEEGGGGERREGRGGRREGRGAGGGGTGGGAGGEVLRCVFALLCHVLERPEGPCQVLVPCCWASQPPELQVIYVYIFYLHPLLGYFVTTENR
jgi:hypothetical protein